ncbi:MAG TPA: TonB-dependent receptor [Massilia sp.]|nr:TonB-dependent receptor [Massilia sp.]
MHHPLFSLRPRALAIWVGLALCASAPAMGATSAQAATPLPAPQADFADLSIEELANIQVTSVSRKPERLQDAPAAVFVITHEDIRRAGARSLPEALRLAPNLQVARADAHDYAISARGFGSTLANKLLVLIDGRSVYSPLFSGVFWDTHDVVMSDVERIEVISGPGATIWGANAVNGVINIITKSARDTQGKQLVVRGGAEGASGSLRHGGATANGGHYRAYAKLIRHDDIGREDGSVSGTGWRRQQAGFRTDWDGEGRSTTLSGDVYEGKLDELGEQDTRLAGANLVARSLRTLADGSTLRLQAYLDHTRREVSPTFTESLSIADVQFQHTLPVHGAHSLVWGANYRHSWDRVTNSEVIAFLPARDRQTWASLFAQDEIALRPDLSLTLGARIERNDYTGNEFLPTARLSWRVDPHHTLWTAASRTVRAPTRLDVDAYIPGRPPYLLQGGRQVRSEVAQVFELGYRGQPLPGLSYSATLFHNDYDHLRTQEIDPTSTFLTFGSLMEGRATGIEMWGSYQLNRAWRLSGGFTALHERLRLKAGSNDGAGPGTAGKDPEHTLQLRAHHAFDERRELEVALRKVAALENPGVPGYWALDARFGWRLRPNLELSLVGQNLNGSHGEYGAVATRLELERRVGVKLVWTN